MRYLLDTNTCIAAMRNDALVLKRMAALSPGDCAISTITSYELATGIEKCANPAKEAAKVNLLFATIGEVAFDATAARESGRIRASLESQGCMIGPYDVLLAGQSLGWGSFSSLETRRNSAECQIFDWRIGNCHRFHDFGGHWPHAMAVLFSGSRIAEGQVIGATEGRGEHPVSRRVGVGDFLATIDRRLRIDAERASVRDRAGRPVPLLQQEGAPIRELMAEVL